MQTETISRVRSRLLRKRQDTSLIKVTPAEMGEIFDHVDDLEQRVKALEKENTCLSLFGSWGRKNVDL